VLQEFGLGLPESTELRVWDSSAEVRYLVLPQRPDGSEGLSEQELAELVTRDSMIGTALATVPGEQAEA
jgi:nitrile hydratase